MGLHPKMAKPVEVIEHAPPVKVVQMTEEPGWYFVGELQPATHLPVPAYSRARGGGVRLVLTVLVTPDFGREFQGGLRLQVADGAAGTVVDIDAGEAMGQKRNKTYVGPVTENVASDWGYNFTWTLREGSQTIEQHEYMEFRYVNLKFSGGVPHHFNLSAWQVRPFWRPFGLRFTCAAHVLVKKY